MNEIVQELKVKTQSKKTQSEKNLEMKIWNLHWNLSGKSCQQNKLNGRWNFRY